MRRNNDILRSVLREVQASESIFWTRALHGFSVGLPVVVYPSVDNLKRGGDWLRIEPELSELAACLPRR